MFQSNGQNSIEGLLRAGPEAISNIMNQAISLGRSMSDKQLAQERDLFAMRQQETNLMQRRAENTQQDMEDAMRFSRSAFESDRRYGLDQQTQSRISANDAFSQDIQNRRMGLLESEFKSEQDAAEEDRKRKAQQLQDFENAYNPKKPAADLLNANEPLPTTPTPQAPPEDSAARDTREILGRGASDPETMKGKPLQKETPPPASNILSPPAETQAAQPDLVTLRTDIKMLEKQKPPENASPEAVRNWTMKIEGMKEQARQLSDKPDEEKPTSKTAAEEERQFRTMILDTKTFPDQRSVLEKGGAKPDDPRFAQADAYEKDKFINEIKSAINKSEDEYAALGGNPEERRKFHQYAMRRKSGGSTTTPPSNSPWNVPELR
jgi:hypothetical protein